MPEQIRTELWTAIAGIDPGMDGGLVAMTEEGMELTVMPTSAVQVARRGKKPGKRRQLDEQGIVNWFRQVKPRLVAIEKIGVRPGEGAVGAFSFGTGWGILRGICAGMGIPYHLVHPKTWQKVVMAHEPKGSEYLVASRLWPTINWLATKRCTKPHGGLLDAALICEFARREL